MPEKMSKHELLLVVISILLALILLAGVGFGFYYLGSKKNNSSGKTTNPTQSSITDASGTSASTDPNQVKQILDDLKGGSGTYDSSKIESQLSDLLSQGGGDYSTNVTLVSESEVKTSTASGKDAIKTYLDGVDNIIAGSQTTSISESALSGLFSGDTSALDAEIAKNQKIYTDLRNVSTPQEAVSIQIKYLSLFKTSVLVMQAEKAMITGSTMDYSSIAKAQGLISLSKEIDSAVAAMKSKYGL